MDGLKVFEGTDMVNNDRCIIKVLKPVADKKIKREIKVLRNLTGGPNIVTLLDVIRDSMVELLFFFQVDTHTRGSY